MDDLFAVFLVVITSGAAVALGAKRLRMSVLALREATLRMFEAVGLAAGFFGANVMLGVMLITLSRLITKDFVSLYVLTEEAVIVLSLLQGITFLFWRNTQPK